MKTLTRSAGKRAKMGAAVAASVALSGALLTSTAGSASAETFSPTCRRITADSVNIYGGPYSASPTGLYYSRGQIIKVDKLENNRLGIVTTYGLWVIRSSTYMEVVPCP